MLLISNSMDVEKQMIAVLCLFTSVKALDRSDHHSVNPLHPSMAVVLTVLAIMFCIIFLIVAYAKFCQRDEPHHQNEAQGPIGVVRTRSRFSGIDRTVVESLPSFQFSSLKGSKEGLDCAVCLSRFEDAEILRLLPRCRHAFHMNCIDKWLENHSSCPLCRYKFDEEDFKSMTQTNSFRYPGSFAEEPHLEFHIQREQNQGRSSRFNIANTIQKLARGKREEPLIREFRDKSDDRRFVHSLRHKIIVYDVMYKSRWSDANSSDLISLSSLMLDDMSSQRFSSIEATSRRFTSDLLAKDRVLKMKEDMEVSDTEHSSTSGTSRYNVELEQIPTSEALDPSQRRSISEITNVSRFPRACRISGVSILANAEKDNVRRLWLPIARRTIQRFSGQQNISKESQKQVIDF